MSRRAPIIAAVLALLVALLAVFLLVLPKKGEISETEDQLQAAQDEEISLNAQLQILQDAQAAAPETEAAIAALEDQVPPTADLPALFRLLQGAADQAAVDFFSFTPGTPIADDSGAYSTIPSTVTVTGGYFSIDEFLFLMETLPRAAKVTSLTLNPSGTEEGGSPSSLQMVMTVEFYTTDSSAGPGSIPGPTEGTVAAAPGETPTTTTDTTTEPGES